MKDYNGKKFIASYSGGKDSTLAIHRSVMHGMIPVEFFTTYNTDRKQSWFHGISKQMLGKISREMGIPITVLETNGELYNENFEAKLKAAKKQGAEVCVFGDIDLDEHLKWCTDRCKAAGIEACFPLWHESRKSLVHEFIDSGFEAMITVVDTSRLPEKFTGKILTKLVAEEIESFNADICGENGEYHTFAFNGPLFKNPVMFQAGEIIKHGQYATVPLI